MDSCYSLPFLLPRGLALCLFSFFFLGFPFRYNLGFCSFSLGWVVGRLRWRWPPAQSRLRSCRTFTRKDLAIASRPASRAGSDRALAAVRTKNHLTRINILFVCVDIRSALHRLVGMLTISKFSTMLCSGWTRVIRCHFCSPVALPSASFHSFF